MRQRELILSHWKKHLTQGQAVCNVTRDEMSAANDSLLALDT